MPTPELPAWIQVLSLNGPIPPVITSRLLGAGESEALALALEQRISRVILDDLPARDFARSLRLEAVGTRAVLYKSKARRLIPDVKCCP